LVRFDVFDSWKWVSSWVGRAGKHNVEGKRKGLYTFKPIFRCDSKGIVVLDLWFMGQKP